MSPEQSAEMIFKLLNEALSEEAPRRKAAEKALRLAEEQQDFFASLVQIVTASDKDASPVVRWLAAVCGKNATPRSWRRRTTRPNAVTDDERQFVTRTLLDSLGEAHSNIATQISVWIAAIARLDFPQHWGSVVADLCKLIRSADSTNFSISANAQTLSSPSLPSSSPSPSIRHALITLDMTLKQLASRRLIADRKALQSIGPETFSLLFELFCSKVDQLIATATVNNMESTTKPFEITVYCLKSLRRLIDHACTDLSQLPRLNQLFVKIESHPELFMCGATGGNDIQIRLSLLVIKLVRKTQARHPISFQPYLIGFLRLYYNIMLAYHADRSDDRTCIHVISFLSSCYGSTTYGITPETMAEFSQQQQSGVIVDIPNEPSELGCRTIVLSFFNEDVINALILVIINKIFVLTGIELETWASDPEALVREEEMAAEWGTENLRYECETFFTAMLVRQKLRLAPYIVGLAKSVPPTEPLLLDACYRAIGRTAANVHGVFEFDSWLEGSLGTVLESACSSDIGARVIQARTVWLIGQFVEQLTRTTRSKVYPSLVRLMSSTQHDRVIALTAAKTIQYLVDDLGFYGEDFALFLPVCINSCFKLIGASSSFETKRDLLDTVGNLVTASEANVIAPVARQIISSMPTLWQECTVSAPHQNVTSSVALTAVEEETDANHEETYGKESYVNGSNGEELLRSSIVTLMVTVIRKTGDVTLQDAETRKIVIAALEFSIDLRPGRGGSHMLEEGCELWLAVVGASKEYNDDLRRFFPQTLKILNRDFENLHKIFELMKEYMLIGGETFMREFSEGIVQTIRNTLGTVRDRGLLGSVEVVDVLLRAFPQEGVRVCKEVLLFMVERVSGMTESGVVMGAYMALIARAALINVGHTESELFRGSEAACVEIMDLLLEHLDSMNRLPKRQVGTLALIGLCGRYLGSEVVLKRMPGVLNCAVQVLSEEKRIRTKQQARVERNDFENMVSRSGEAGEADPFAIFGEGRTANPVSHGQIRTKALAEKDTEVCMGVGDACMELLTKLHEAHESYSRVVSSTDPNVLGQLEGLLQVQR